MKSPLLNTPTQARLMERVPVFALETTGKSPIPNDANISRRISSLSSHSSQTFHLLHWGAWWGPLVFGD